MPKLKTGIKAPVFSLLNQKGETFSTKKLETNHTVVYFYPKDLTPGCTLEAEEFTKHLKAFTKLETKIVGISGGGVDSKIKFCKKHKLKIDLLADEDFSVSKKFGAYGDKNFMGKTFKGIIRKTFIINKTGKIVQIYDKVTAEGHAEEVLEFISRIGKKHEKGRETKASESPKRNKKLTKNYVTSKAKKSKKA